MKSRQCMHVIVLFVFAFASPVFSAELTEEQKIEAQLNPAKNSVNLEIEIARQIALQVNKNSDWKAAASRITTGLKNLLKPYLDLYAGSDVCSKNANLTVYSAIVRGSTNYANCVTAASSKSQPRIDQLMITAASIKAKTAASSISNFIQSCLKRFFSFNIFNVFLGCPSDFVGETFKFMNTTVAEVKNEINGGLSDSVKVAKCADDVTNEATRQATFSLSLFNYCKSRQVTTTTKKPATNATNAPTPAPNSTQAPSQNSTQAPAQNSTQAPAQNSTQAPAQNSTQAPSQNSTQAPSQNSTQAPSQNSTQAPSQNSTQAPSQNSTQAPAQNSTQAPSQNSTQAPSQNSTQAPTQAPTQATTQAPTQATTQAPTQPPPPQRANFSAIIQAGIDNYQKFDVRISELQNLISEAVLTTENNYGELLNLDLISLTDSVTNAGVNSRNRIENIRSRNSANPTVQSCYTAADEALNNLTTAEGFVAQDCYYLNSANMANLLDESTKLQADFNIQRSQNGQAKIAECANDAAVNLSNEQVTACVDQVLTSTDVFLTASTNSSLNAIAVSPTIVASTTKCVSDASAKVRTGAQGILDRFRACSGINA